MIKYCLHGKCNGQGGEMVLFARMRTFFHVICVYGGSTDDAVLLRYLDRRKYSISRNYYRNRATLRKQLRVTQVTLYIKLPQKVVRIFFYESRCSIFYIKIGRTSYFINCATRTVVDICI